MQIDWIEQATILEKESGLCALPLARERLQGCALALKQSRVKDLGDLNVVIKELANAFALFDQLIGLDIHLIDPIPADDAVHDMEDKGQKIIYDMSKAVHLAHGILSLQSAQPLTPILNQIVVPLLDFVDGSARTLLPEAAQNSIDDEQDLLDSLKNPNFVKDFVLDLWS
jgi:hypothetical protein